MNLQAADNVASLSLKSHSGLSNFRSYTSTKTFLETPIQVPHIYPNGTALFREQDELCGNSSSTQETIKEKFTRVSEISNQVHHPRNILLLWP